jgi:phosphonate transport system substrate-binding protein
MFAFGDVDSTSGHRMAYHELRNAGDHPEVDLRSRYIGSHLAAAARVANEEICAGAVDKTVFDSLLSKEQLDYTKVRVSYISTPHVDCVRVARGGMPRLSKKRFLDTFIALRKKRDDALLNVLRAHKFVLAGDEEYASARQIAHQSKLF